jgi:uncharacterized protein RhaS with RHS repeats
MKLLSGKQCLRGAAALALILAASAPAYAQETTTYTYDAKGRVVGVVRSGGPSSGTNTQYQYDKADNRTNVTVSNYELRNYGDSALN